MKRKEELHRLVEIVSTLRGPGGCPWDREQDLRSMRPYLLEEVYEALEAMDKAHLPGADDALHEELGDLLFVVLLLCQIAEDQNRFDLESVCKRISDKMVDRHPHVFGGGGPRPRDAAGSLETWEAQKARLKPRTSRLDGVPSSLPSLLRAHRQGEKAAAAGFDWKDHGGAMEKVEEELQELKEAISDGDRGMIRHELGDLLMSLSSLGRHLEAPPEESLREANDRFKLRFSTMEKLAKQRSLVLAEAGDETLDALWEQAKRLCKDKDA
jgi:MazG family protein